jgi:hypothetical protein
VVAVGVRVDNGRNRFGRQVPDGLYYRPPPVRQLRVDDDDAGRADEDSGVTAAAFSMNRLSRSFSTSTTFGAAACAAAPAAGCCDAVAASRITQGTKVDLPQAGVVSFALI